MPRRLASGWLNWKSVQWQTCALVSWNAIASAAFYSSYTKLGDDAHDLVWTYFQPLCPPLLMIWLWAINLKHFESRAIEYDVCFKSTEKRFLVSHSDIIQLSLVLTATATTCVAGFTLSCLTGQLGLAQQLPALTYFLLLLVLLYPGHGLYRPTRHFFCSTLLRVLLPVDSVSWADFLLADMLTSLAKSVSDFDRAMCKMATGPVLGGLVDYSQVEPGTCSSLSWHALLALCWPYLIRFVQCLRVYAATGNVAQVFNALKYFSAFPALLLSAVEHEYHVSSLGFAFQHTWLLAMLCNSLFSYYWDLEQDWDMPWLAQKGGWWWGFVKLPGLRSELWYGMRWYYLAAATNLLMRMTWTYRMMGQLEAQRHAVLLVAMLEVVRRYQWVYIRFETELRKIQMKVSHSHPLLDS